MVHHLDAVPSGGSILRSKVLSTAQLRKLIKHTRMKVCTFRMPTAKAVGIRSVHTTRLGIDPSSQHEYPSLFLNQTYLNYVVIDLLQHVSDLKVRYVLFAKSIQKLK